MSYYSPKNWKDRDVEHPGRRTITDVVSGTSQTVDVIRSEGTVTEPGDAFISYNLNDLEGRISSAFLLVEGAKLEKPSNNPREGQVVKYSNGAVVWDNESGGGGGGTTFNDYTNISVLVGDWTALGTPSPVPGATYKNEIILSGLEEDISIVSVIPSAEMVEDGLLYPLVGVEDDTLILYSTALPTRNYTIPIVSVRSINEVV